MSTQFDLIEIKLKQRLFTWKFVQVRPVASGIYRRSSFVSVGRWKEAAAGGAPLKFNLISTFRTIWFQFLFKQTKWPSTPKVHSFPHWTDLKINWKWMNISGSKSFQKFFLARDGAAPSNPTHAHSNSPHPEIPNLGRTRFRWRPSDEHRALYPKTKQKTIVTVPPFNGNEWKSQLVSIKLII